jgi:hypothetical protein
MTTDIVDVKAALTESLTELHLPTVRRTYEEAARLAERETLSYERYLLDLVTRESQDRQQKRIQRLLRQSRIPAEKALANFNLKRLPPKVAILTKSLIEGEVLDRRENVLAFGNPGSGKTHLLCAIGQELIARGRRMYFTTSALLVQDLLVAKRDLKLSRFLKKLAHFEGLSRTFGVNVFSLRSLRAGATPVSVVSVAPWTDLQRHPKEARGDDWPRRRPLRTRASSVCDIICQRMSFFCSRLHCLSSNRRKAP